MTIHKQDLYRLCRAVKADISDEYRASDDPDDDVPGIQLTVATNDAMDDWSYQTGDNSYTGGAYGYPHWAVVGVYRASNCRELANEIIDELKELVSQAGYWKQ